MKKPLNTVESNFKIDVENLIKSKDETINLLKQQVETKDKLIENQSEQLKNFQILLKQQDKALMLEKRAFIKKAFR